MTTFNYIKSAPAITSYDNSLDAWVPELWAQESLAILEENMVIGNLVHRDFSTDIANFGDTVNTRKPGEFSAKRKTDADDVTVQDATAENIPVKLDQHIHTSFMIKDGQESLSFKSLIDVYLKPAALSLARRADQILLGQAYQFLKNSYGAAGTLTKDVVKSYFLNTRELMNVNKAPVEGRNFILTPSSETTALELDFFLGANTVGDDGTALRNASLGHKLGFNFFMCQNTPSVLVAAGTEAADDLASDAAAGATTLSVDAGHGANYTVGQYITLEGDLKPYKVTAISTDDLTINRPLRTAVAAAASNINRITVGAAKGAYAAGYSKGIVVDGTGVPHVGQLISFGAGTAEYCIIDVTAGSSEWTILLDRPLEADVADNAVAGYGSTGEFNFAFTKNAVALVSRPLALPKQGAGALAGVANYHNLALRVTITYNGTKQGHLVTLDMLCGVKVLDKALGAVMIG